MAEIFQNREQNIEHVEIYISEHRMRFSCIAGPLERPIAGGQHRSVWPSVIGGVKQCTSNTSRQKR